MPAPNAERFTTTMPSEAAAADLLERAALADRQARWDDAMRLLQGSADWPAPHDERALLLRATILMMRDPIAALDELPENAEAFTTHEGRVHFFLTAARAYGRARNFSAAEKMLDAARSELGEQKSRGDTRTCSETTGLRSGDGGCLYRFRGDRARLSCRYRGTRAL